MGPVLPVIGVIACSVVGTAVLGVMYGAVKLGSRLISWINCKLFSHTPNSPYVEVAEVTPEQIKQIQKKIQPSNIQWKKIYITQYDRQVLEKLTTQEFWNEAELYQCAIAKGYQVMCSPVGMNCCQGKQLADKNILLDALKKNPHKCPMCNSKADINSIIQDGHHIKVTKNGIEKFRKRIKVTFEKLNSELKKQFESMVKQSFGENYQI